MHTVFMNHFLERGGEVKEENLMKYNVHVHVYCTLLLHVHVHVHARIKQSS